MKVDKQVIRATAKLAKLEIPEKEMESYLKEFNEILEYVDELNRLETKNVKPTSHIIEEGTPLRDDRAGEPLNKKEILRNNPARGQTSFAVPKFID
jgi:aspartyl-tRNA(Asn)/glutamyl-tRNA(Gln) amidotransferase subunit C